MFETFTRVKRVEREENQELLREHGRLMIVLDGENEPPNSENRHHQTRKIGYATQKQRPKLELSAECLSGTLDDQ